MAKYVFVHCGLEKNPTLPRLLFLLLLLWLVLNPQIHLTGVCLCLIRDILGNTQNSLQGTLSHHDQQLPDQHQGRIKVMGALISASCWLFVVPFSSISASQRAGTLCTAFLGPLASWLSLGFTSGRSSMKSEVRRQEEEPPSRCLQWVPTPGLGQPWENLCTWVAAQFTVAAASVAATAAGCGLWLSSSVVRSWWMMGGIHRWKKKSHLGSRKPARLGFPMSLEGPTLSDWGTSPSSTSYSEDRYSEDQALSI